MKKKPPLSRSNIFLLIESLIWIVLTFLIRAQLDRAAERWQLSQPVVFLLKIGVVLAIIAIAIGLHGLLSRWLTRRGILPQERQE